MIKPLEEEDLSDTLHTKGFTVDSVKEAPYTTVFAADLALTQENIIFYKVSVYISSDNGKTWIEAGLTPSRRKALPCSFPIRRERWKRV